MNLAHAIAPLAIVAACSSSHATPDAAATTDAAHHDAPSTGDAPIDGSVPCPQGQLCFQLTPVDGVTNLPSGRLAIAWVSEATSTPIVEVAYDQPWVPAPITMIDIAHIATPSASVQTNGIASCASSYAASLAVLSTDPDGSGSISSDEILNGIHDHSVYGIHQEMVAWFSDACAADPPSYPDGFAKGIHVYSSGRPVHRLDGTATAFETCQPGSAACSNLNSPF